MKQSKFRFAKIQPFNREASYRNLNLFDTSGTSLSIASSSEYVATTAMSVGRINVIPCDRSKFDPKKSPLIAAHPGGLGDIKFNPFHPNFIGTVGDECLRLWKIPTGGLQSNVSKPDSEVTGMLGPAHALDFHPTVDNLVAVACKHGLTICDLETSKSIKEFEISSSGKDLINVNWDYYGKTATCIGKDYSLYNIDPREHKGSEMKGVKSTGFRPQRANTMGSKGYVIVSGVSSSRQPCVHIFDPRKSMKESLCEEELNFSPGYLFPMYDMDTGILALTARGSQMIRLFDCNKAVKKGELKSLSQGNAGIVIQGACMAPKYSLDVMSSEIIRLYVRNKSDIAPIPISVPRKVQDFYPELYPNTLSNQAYDTTAEAWLKGNDVVPKLLSIDAKLSLFNEESKKKIQEEEKKAQAKKAEEAEKKAKAQAKLEEPSEVRKKISAKLKRSAFVYLGGKSPSSKDKYYYDLKAGKPLHMYKNIDVNSKFIAFPWKAVGGSAVAVIAKEGKMGRLISPPKVRGHTAQVSAFSLSQQQPNRMATGSPEGIVKVWTLPNKPTKDLTDCEIELECSGKVLGTLFHPLVPDVLLTYSAGYSAVDMRLWDLTEKKEKVLIEAHGEAVIWGVTWNHNGSLIATIAKDHRVRIIDPRQNKVVSEFEVSQGSRESTVYFLDTTDDILAVVGVAKGNAREISVHNTKDGKCLDKMEIEGESGSLMPAFDPDTRLLYVSTNGAPSVQFFLLSTESPYIERLDRFKSMQDFKGFVMASKHECDVKNVEVAVGWQLSKNSVIPISFTVPRKRKEFFQDDLFAPTASASPMMSAKAWFEGKSKEEVKYVSLQPEGMGLLSTAPKEKLTQRELKYRAHKQMVAKPKAKGVLGHESAQEVREHFQNLAEMIDTTSNMWDAGGGGASSDDEWSD